MTLSFRHKKHEPSTDAIEEKLDVGAPKLFRLGLERLFRQPNLIV